jgi:dTDP-4-dehydrorhamnose reductase
MNRNVAVIGASGLIGGAVFNQLLARKHGGESLKITGTFFGNAEDNMVMLDVTSFSAVDKFFERYSPKVIFLCSGIPGIDDCQAYQFNHSHVVNVMAVENIVRIARTNNTKIVYFSSGYVFDGTENKLYSVMDAPNPLQRYGRQKLIAENYVLAGSPKNIVIRTVGVFGKDKKRKNFAHQLVDGLRLGKNVFVPNDQHMTPVYSSSLAFAAVSLGLGNLGGVFHVAGNDCVSKYDFALLVSKAFELNITNVIGIETLKMKQAAKRPVYCCLTGIEGYGAKYLFDLEYAINTFLHECDA